MAEHEVNNEMVCECGDPIKQGFRNEGTASYDNRWWVHVICGKPTEAWLRALGDDMLNYFRGGPIDGTAYETSTLLAPVSEGSIPITEYKWTPEVITSEKTGRTARVWLHKSMADTYVPPAEEPAAPSASGDAAAPDQPAAPTAEAGTLDLAEFRKRLKLSRKQVAQMTGLSEAKVARIESGSARTTDDELGQVREALEAYQLHQGVAS